MNFQKSRKVFLLIALLSIFILPKPTFATDTSSLSPGTMADDSSIGTQAWQNVNNAKVSDDVYATAQSICFIAGTKIKTPTGDVNIESLQKDQLVLGFDENQKIQDSKVLVVSSRQSDDIVLVITDSGSVTTTPEHPFYVGNGKFKEIKDINIGDYLYNSAFEPQRLLSKTTVHQKTTVYNLTVDKTHTFFANDFAVHNKSVWHYLKATNFGFAIPTGSTIDGIRAEVEFKSNANFYSTDEVHIVKNGGTLGTENKGLFSHNFPLTDTSTFYGSSADSWGETWTAADINSSDFGLAFSVTINAETVSVDHMAIVVSYTKPQTLYWFQSGADSDWTTLSGNWWTDAAHTSQASLLPDSSTSVITVGTTSPRINLGTWTAPSSIIVTSTGLWVTATSTDIGVPGFSSTVTGNVSFNDYAILGGGLINGNVIFRDNSRNYGTGAIVDGHTVDFYNNTANVRAINGTITFHDTSYNASNSAISGTVVFDDSSYNYTVGAVSGDATFNNSSTNQNVVTGTATFNGDLSENQATSTTGTSTRRYTSNISPTRDFVTTGPWTILADGVQVDLTNGATFNGSTVLTTANGGSFITSKPTPNISGQTGGYSIIYGCGDPKATNFQRFIANRSDLCRYSDSSSNISPSSITVANTTTAVNFKFTRNLKKGMSGTDVYELQKRLIKLNLGQMANKLEKNGLTNMFGPLTQAALVELQKLNSLPGTGFFGPITRTLINQHIN
ncbi:MAG: Hint domain-containing protein [bacterium]